MHPVQKVSLEPWICILLYEWLGFSFEVNNIFSTLMFSFSAILWMCRLKKTLKCNDTSSSHLVCQATWRTPKIQMQCFAFECGCLFEIRWIFEIQFVCFFTARLLTNAIRKLQIIYHNITAEYFKKSEDSVWLKGQMCPNLCQLDGVQSIIFCNTNLPSNILNQCMEPKTVKRDRGKDVVLQMWEQTEFKTLDLNWFCFFILHWASNCNPT